MCLIIIKIGSINDTGLRTDYDRSRLLYLDQMGGMVIPMSKIFTIFSILSMTFLALPNMSGFIVELMIFFLEY
ncbi:hypothetical protein Ahy_A09g044736 isoform A [Arachis hypogaea]|uniref:NADH:quinone oxidoreductase/Mrp antiporter membrane subunit domain-containing protein n=2 Tax=Arachis hypogaea TaxID=3818 RepID=A0A445BKP4_ARAHY|nr:hypothetical protein Ahy_A09g044736 isoform A [Arachis hypogaea]